jgi:hypothetical protein
MPLLREFLAVFGIIATLHLNLALQGALLTTRRKHPARRVARRGYRRSEGVLAIVFGFALLCILILGGAIGLPFVYRETADQPGGNAQVAAQQSSGRIVSVGINDQCRESGFNNVNGRLYEGHAIPCPKSESQKGYQYPANRLQRIGKGF